MLLRLMVLDQECRHVWCAPLEETMAGFTSHEAECHHEDEDEEGYGHYCTVPDVFVVCMGCRKTARELKRDYTYLGDQFAYGQTGGTLPVFTVVAGQLVWLRNNGPGDADDLRRKFGQQAQHAEPAAP